VPRLVLALFRGTKAAPTLICGSTALEAQSSDVHCTFFH
jgi:hypothetical protein